jgi:hypothetical protein
MAPTRRLTYSTRHAGQETTYSGLPIMILSPAMIRRFACQSVGMLCGIELSTKLHGRSAYLLGCFLNRDPKFVKLATITRSRLPVPDTPGWRVIWQ